MQMLIQFIALLSAVAVQDVAAKGEIIVPSGTADGIYNHIVHSNGTVVVHHKETPDADWKFLPEGTHGILYNGSGTIPTTHVTRRDSMRSIAGRITKRDYTHCDGNPVQYYEDVRNAISGYENYLNNNGGSFGGNTFSVKSNGVAYGCAFNGAHAYFNGGDYAQFTQIMDSQCGSSDRAYYNPSGDYGFGRLQANEGFCGGGGVPYGDPNNY